MKPDKVIVPEEDKPVRPEATPRLDTSQLVVSMARVSEFPPIAIAPEVEPVPMLVVLVEALLLIEVAPVNVNPPVPCNSPEPELTPTAVMAPVLVTLKLLLLVLIKLVNVPFK